MKKNKILVVDDELSIQELLFRNLSSCGFKIICVSNGEDALKEIKAEIPDLIILDVTMPKIDCWEVLKIVRDLYSYEKIKIIMLSGKNTEKDKMIGKCIFKADEYITKPFELNNLILKVQELLNEIG